MWALLLGLSAIAAPPENLDLDAVERWDSHAFDALAGPAGCWEMVGKASWNWDLGRFAETKGEAIFAGRPEDGQWTAFFLKPAGEIARRGKEEAMVRYEASQRFLPLVGTYDETRVVIGSDSEVQDAGEDGAEEPDEPEEQTSRRRRRSEPEAGEDEPAGSDGPSNPVRSLMDELTGDSFSSYVVWKEDLQAVELVRTVTLDGNDKPAELRARFPEGGTIPVSLDVDFPDRFTVPFGEGRFSPRAWISDATLSVRGRPYQGGVMPTMESYSFRFGALGFSFSGAQTIQYHQAKRCEAATVAD